MSRFGTALAVGVVLCALPSAARAHGLRPGVLTMSEQDQGSYQVQWTPPIDTRPGAEPVGLRWPEHCEYAPPRLECDASERLRVEVTGLRAHGGRVVVSVAHLDGRVAEDVATIERPVLDLEGPPRTPATWIELGIRHILGGADHLAFLIGLLLVASGSRWSRLIATITAFTVAHSLTLVLAVMGVLVVAAGPVEATIAASVILVAHEALGDRSTISRRRPWLVASVFGLVHGLGFAGSLAQWGLPAGWVGRSLLWFNVGVELGQLAVVVPLAIVVRRLGERARAPSRVAAYVCGALGAWWLLDRVHALVTAAA